MDPVTILNQFAIFSTTEDDPIFWGTQSEKPIFCAGRITHFNDKVSNFKKNEYVGYISTTNKSEIIKTSNLVNKIDINNKRLITILPYASYAMKILREIDFTIGSNVLIVGFNFFSILLFKLIKLTGSNIKILKIKPNNKLFQNNGDIGSHISNDISHIKNISYQNEFDHVILISRLNSHILELFNSDPKLKFKKLSLTGSNIQISVDYIEESKIVKITKFDKGFLDLNYINGATYPYSYVRWDYKRNLEYFIYLVRNNLISLDFLEYNEKSILSNYEISELIENLTPNRLYLFEKENP